MRIGQLAGQTAVSVQTIRYYERRGLLKQARRLSSGIWAETDTLRLIEIGEMAGPTISLSAAALRSSGIEIYGSGGGSIPHTAIFDAFPQLWALAASGKLRIDTEPVSLAEIENAWQRTDLPGRRLVIKP